MNGKHISINQRIHKNPSVCVMIKTNIWLDKSIQLLVDLYVYVYMSVCGYLYHDLRIENTEGTQWSVVRMEIYVMTTF